jgi:hypothetical protein
MLWPELRDTDPDLGSRIPGPSKILRTTSRSYLRVPAGYLPAELSEWSAWLNRLLPWLFTTAGDVEIGPIPKGTPVNLLANLELISERPEDFVEHKKKLIEVKLKLIKQLKSLPKDATDDDAKAAFKTVVPDLLALNKCPDFIVNKGHYFGSNLSDDDKNALIEFLKTF